MVNIYLSYDIGRAEGPAPCSPPAAFTPLVQFSSAILYNPLLGSARSEPSDQERLIRILRLEACARKPLLGGSSWEGPAGSKAPATVSLIRYARCG